MQYQKWMDIVELVGVAAIVASLIFVGLQLRQDSDIARTEADLSYLGILVEVRQLLNDDADIWVKANSGIELSNAEAFVFSNLVRTENDRRFYQHEAAARLYGKDEAATIMHDFAAFLYQHPAARADWAVQENNYLKFRRILQAGYDYSFWMNGINSDLAALDEGDARRAQPVDIPRDQYVEINGARLHYLDWGGNGPTMLMVHGLWQTAHWYDGIAPHFTDRYRVIGITRREHGASQKGTGQLSLDVLVDDLSDFL